MKRMTAFLAAIALATLGLGDLYPPATAAADTTGQPAEEQSSEPVPGVNPDETLSEQLSREKGVIDPPPIGDPDIYTDAPDPDPGTTRVIPPPDTPGGDPTIEPK